MQRTLHDCFWTIWTNFLKSPIKKSWRCIYFFSKKTTMRSFWILSHCKCAFWFHYWPSRLQIFTRGGGKDKCKVLQSLIHYLHVHPTNISKMKIRKIVHSSSLAHCSLVKITKPCHKTGQISSPKYIFIKCVILHMRWFAIFAKNSIYHNKIKSVFVTFISLFFFTAHLKENTFCTHPTTLKSRSTSSTSA